MVKKYDMSIEYGELDYFELLSLNEYLKNCRLKNLDLKNLNKLRTEVETKITAIHLSYSKMKSE